MLVLTGGFYNKACLKLVRKGVMGSKHWAWRVLPITRLLSNEQDLVSALDPS